MLIRYNSNSIFKIGIKRKQEIGMRVQVTILFVTNFESDIAVSCCLSFFAWLTKSKTSFLFRWECEQYKT